MTASHEFDAYQEWLGISAAEQPPNHYRLLGLPVFLHDETEIRGAARRRMQHVRTYALSQHGERCQQLLNDLADAMQCLVDAEQRQAYDAELRTALPESALSELEAAPKTQYAPLETQSEPLQPGQPHRRERDGQEISKLFAEPGVAADAPQSAEGIAASSAKKTAARLSLRPRPLPVRQASKAGVGKSESADGSRSSVPWHIPLMIVGVGFVLVLGVLMLSESGDDGSSVAATKGGSAGSESPSTIKEIQVKPPPVKPPPAPKPKAKSAEENKEFVETVSAVSPPAETPPPASEQPMKPPSIDQQASPSAGEIVFADFEGEDYGEWEVTEAAFGQKPARDAQPGQATVYGHVGDGFATSFRAAGRGDGMLVSPEFAIERPYINFRIGGSGDHSMVCIVLYTMLAPSESRPALRGMPMGPRTFNGRHFFPVATTQGQGKGARLDSSDERLVPRTWDVRAFVGQPARIVIADYVPLPGAHLNVDHITFSDKPLAEVLPATTAVAGRSAVPTIPPGNIPRHDPPPPPGVVEPAPERLPIPTDEEIRLAVREIHEDRKDAFDAADSIREKYELAKQLFGDANQATDDNPAMGYALFKEACDINISIGNPEGLMETVYALAQRFEIDDIKMRADVYWETNRNVKNTAARQTLIKHALVAMEDAIKNDRYGEALRLVNLAKNVADRLRDGALTRQLRSDLRRVTKAQADYDDMQQALKVLEQNADDPDANLTAGTFYCLRKADWEQGLPMLAKGSDEALRELAQMDLRQPESDDERLRMADRWWDVAEGKSEKDNASTLAMVRAAEWYRRAWANLPKDAISQARIRLIKGLEQDPRAVYLDPRDHVVSMRTSSTESKTFPIDRQYTKFNAQVSIDTSRSAVFRLFGDGNLLWEKILSLSNKTEICEVGIVGVSELKLEVTSTFKYSSNSRWEQAQVSR